MRRYVYMFFSGSVLSTPRALIVGPCITVLLKLDGPTTSDDRGGKQISQTLMNGKSAY